MIRAGAAAAALALTLAAAGDARAADPPKQVSPTGKGIVGGALLGGEVVTITMGAAGLEKGWPYFVFGGLGMVGGGVGGYFVEKATKGTTNSSGVTSGATPEPALYMLAGGMALVIPALIVSLNATAYKPPESDRNEQPGNEPTKQPVKVTPPPGGGEPPPPPETTSRSRKKARGRREFSSLPHIPVSLLDVYRGKVGLGIPALELKPLYTHLEMAQYGVAQGTEVKLPVFKAMF